MQIITKQFENEKKIELLKRLRIERYIRKSITLVLIRR